MPTSFMPAWSRYFGLEASPTVPPPQPSRRDVCATGGTPVSQPPLRATRLEPSAPPPQPGALTPTKRQQETGAPGKAPQPLPPALPCPQIALKWVVSHLPEGQRAEVLWAFEKTLLFRAGEPHPASLEGKQPIERERFGLAGETLVPEGTLGVRRRIDDEVRETLRTLEMPLSRTRRNHYLAMHSARLGQLWMELERRLDFDVLADFKNALARRWG